MANDDRIKAVCIACGTVGTKKRRLAPKNNKEKAQLDFRCRACGALNLRGGHKAIYDRGMPPEEGAPTPKDKAALPEVHPPTPKVQEPERSKDDEQEDDSLTIL